MSDLSPKKLIAPCKDYIWGGTRLREEFGKKSDDGIVAESWELSCHKDGLTKYQGRDGELRNLEDFIQASPEVLGTNCAKFDRFPVLVKLIDAKDNLSLQVHPNNEYALKNEGELGKTEMWYIVDAEPGAKLIFGFKQTITKEEFAARIADNTILDVVNAVPVKKGDVFFIEAGTLHAIGAGIVIAEVQQNSNITYRVYDYDRKDANGNGRQLHTAQAIEVTTLSPAERRPVGKPVSKPGRIEQLLGECAYFSTKLIEVDAGDLAILEADASSFQAITLLEGACELDSISLKKGDSAFIPANHGKYKIIVNGNKQVRLLHVSIPNLNL